MNHGKSVVILNLCAFLTMLGVGMIVTVLPRRILFLSGSVSDTGYLASAFALTFVLCQIPAGRLSDRFGARFFIAAGYAVCGAAGLLFLCSATVRTYLLGRMLQGIGEIPVWAMAPALLAVYHPRRKGTHIGIYNACIHAGLTLGSLAGIWVEEAWPGTGVFISFTVLSILSSVLIIVGIPAASVRSTARTGDVRWQAEVFKPERLVIFSGICCYGAGYGICVSIVPAFLMDALGAGPGLVGLLFMLFYVGIGLSQILAGRVSDRWGREGTMAAGLLAAGTGLVLFSAGSLSWLPGCLFLAAGGLGTFCVSALAFLNDRVSERLNGTITGAFYFFWGIGYSLGPLALGAVGRSWGWPGGFALAGILFLVQLAVCLGFWGMEKWCRRSEKAGPV